MGQPLPLQLTPVLGSLIGIGTALVLAALIIVLIMRFRDQDRRSGRSSATEYDKAAVPLHADPDDSFDLKDKKSAISENDTRDEEERAFDKILSTSKRMLVSPSKSGTLKNGSVSNVTWSPDGTIYAQIDQAKRHSVAGAVPLNAAITAASPPSGYVRLPPVDHFHLIPYADTSSSSPSPSQYSGLTQQVRWSRGEPETISVDSREMKMGGVMGGASAINTSMPVSEIQVNVPTTQSNWVTPVGTTRL